MTDARLASTGDNRCSEREAYALTMRSELPAAEPRTIVAGTTLACVLQ